MDKPIAIIGAMDEEVEELRESLTDRGPVCTPLPNLPLSTGNLGRQAVVVCRCGIGKVNAAMATQYIIDQYRPTAIINSGIAGGASKKMQIGDIVLGTSSMQHDFDLGEFGRPRGIIPRLPTSVFQGDPNLLEAAFQAAGDILPAGKVHQGLIVTGDQFIGSKEKKEEILEFFPDALCVEMEGAAIAQVATANEVPHLIIRAISDLADDSAPQDFEQFITKIVPVLNRILARLLIRWVNRTRSARHSANR